MLVGRRVEQQPRVLRRPRGQHDDVRLLHLALLVTVVIFDTGDARALAVGQYPGDGAPWPHLGTDLPRVAQIGDERIGKSADRAADMAPAVINAGSSALV